MRSCDPKPGGHVNNSNRWGMGYSGAACALAFVAACACSSGSGGDGDTRTPAPTPPGSDGPSTIDQLPRATSPVMPSSTSLLSAVHTQDHAGDATTGIAMGTLSSSDFDASSSRAACEMANQMRDAITDAAQGDLLLCYVQTVAASNPTLGLGNIDIYDGSPHVFVLEI